MSIEIRNLRKGITSEEYAFIVDRRTPLGNPFVMEKEEDRDEVCDKYEDYFYEILLQKPEALEYLDKIKDAFRKHGKVIFYCWCAPKRCHSETIRNFLFGKPKVKEN